MTHSDRRSPSVPTGPQPKGEQTLVEETLPPVVARLVVEIRSDGTRTIARGALEDATRGERTALVAEGTTPLALAASLTKTLLSAPMLARQAVTKALRGRKRR